VWRFAIFWEEIILIIEAFRTEAFMIIEESLE
jgi:hypothetical protein